MFNSLDRPMSPKKDQAYIWMAEYLNGSLTEFELDGSRENNFKDIEKDKLVRFGLIGQGKKFWHEVKGGTFNVMGRRFNFSFKDENGVVYNLTSNGNILQNDIITYKQAEARSVRDFTEAQRAIALAIQERINSGEELSDEQIKAEIGTIHHKTVSSILGYYFGYKTQFTVNELEVNFKPIFSLEVSKPAFFEFTLMFSEDIKGEFIVTRNNEVVETFKGEFKKDKKNQLRWQLKLA